MQFADNADPFAQADQDLRCSRTESVDTVGQIWFTSLPRGNFVDHIFLKAQYLARILQHVSLLAMEALPCNSLLHTLLFKTFDNLSKL